MSLLKTVGTSSSLERMASCGGDETAMSTQKYLAGCNILVADDEPSIRELLRDILEPDGAHVYLASSGSEALAIIQADSPDLAILDIRMPAPGGLAILEHLRASGSTLPVLIITAHDFVSARQEIMQRGADDYITKPFDPDRVLTIVEQTLQRRVA